MIELYVFWLVYSLLEGVREGATFAHKGYLVEWPYNIHSYFMLTRVWVGAYLVYIFGFDRWMDTAMFAVALAAAFSFWHNGAYYTTRRYQDYPTYHFFSTSTTTTAKTSFTAVERSILFVFSLGLIAFIGKMDSFLNKTQTVFVGWFGG